MSENASTAQKVSPPSTRQVTPAARPVMTGHMKFFFRWLHEARRHAITGPTPIRKSSAKPSGALTRLKNGGPTVIFTPRTHSEMTGNTVPQNTANAMPTRMRLLNRNADSRDTSESSSFSLRSIGRRQINSDSETVRMTPRKPRKNGPRPDCVNEWTEEITPLRVRNVPKIVSEK